MISREKFKNFVNELTSQEEQSLYKEPDYSNHYFLVIIGIILLVLGFVNFFNGSGIVFIFIGFALLCFTTMVNAKSTIAKRNYRNKYINEILDCLLEGYDYKFESDGKIEGSIFDKSQFVTNYDIYKGSDKLTVNIPNDDGSVSSTYLTLCDLDVYKIETRIEFNSFNNTNNNSFNNNHGHKVEKVEVNVYKGVFGYVDFPFEFRCVLGLNSKYRKKGVNLETVRLEDLQFNKKYGVYCNDQIEARYILTPDMMEKLLNLYRAYKGIKVVLVDNRMYFSFPSKNLLELSNYRGDNTTVFDGIYDDISNILSIVEEIKNNNKIFKM